MSGRIYDPAQMQAVINKAKLITPKGKLITPGTGLPRELQAKEALTLDQIDARQVRIEVLKKASYHQARVRITNTTIRLMTPPSMPLGLVKDLLMLAVEARRRLRHPDNQAHAAAFQGIAFGKLTIEPEEMEELVKRGSLAGGSKFPTVLTVTIDGKEVVAVKLDDIQKEDAEKEQ